MKPVIHEIAGIDQLGAAGDARDRVPELMTPQRNKAVVGVDFVVAVVVGGRRRGADNLEVPRRRKSTAHGCPISRRTIIGTLEMPAGTASSYAGWGCLRTAHA